MNESVLDSLCRKMGEWEKAAAKRRQKETAEFYVVDVGGKFCAIPAEELYRIASLCGASAAELAESLAEITRRLAGMANTTDSLSDTFAVLMEAEQDPTPPALRLRPDYRRRPSYRQPDLRRCRPTARAHIVNHKNRRRE